MGDLGGGEGMINERRIVLVGIWIFLLGVAVGLIDGWYLWAK